MSNFLLAYNSFLSNITKFINSSGDGYVVSPFSISYLTLILYLGATNETKREIGSLFSLKNAANDEKIILDVIKMRNELIKSGIVKIENGYFINEKYYNKIKSVFLSLLQKNGFIKNYNLKNKSKVVKEVNEWITKITNGLINNILSNEDISENTQMILANCIYFKSMWKNKFPTVNTEFNSFYSSDNNRKKVQFMNQKEFFFYYEDTELQLLEMDYQNRDFSFGIFLPKNNLNRFYHIENYLSSMNQTKVNVFIPKFTQKNKINLQSIFSSMSCSRMFDNREAEFYNMIEYNINGITNINDVLYVGEILHDAVIIIDEEGTEATAATIVTMNCAYSFNIEQNIIFRADHTFQYYLRYKPLNLILFTGIYDGATT